MSLRSEAERERLNAHAWLVHQIDSSNDDVLTAVLSAIIDHHTLGDHVDALVDDIYTSVEGTNPDW